MKNGFKLIYITAPLIAAGVAFVGYTIKNKPAPQRIEIAERATAVRVITAKTHAITPKITGYGYVKPARTYDAISRVNAEAEYVHPELKNGTILPAGTEILRLSQVDFALAVAQAKANIRSANARLAEISINKENLAAALNIEKQVLDLKEKDLARIQSLVSAGTAAQTALDNTRTAYLAQRQKVTGLESSLALIPTQQTAQTEQIAVYEANLASAELNLERTVLTLPFSARVGAISVEQGQFVKAGQSVAKFDGVDAAEIEAQIPVAGLRVLLNASGASPLASTAQMPEFFGQLGIHAAVQLDLGDGIVQWDGKVDRISDTVDQKSGTIGVIIRVPDAYKGAEVGTRPPLTKGMFVEVSLTANPINGITIPRSALVNGKIMVINADDRLELQAVTPQLLQGELALIQADIAEDTRIVVSKPSPMMEGMLLDPHDDPTLMKKLETAK